MTFIQATSTFVPDDERPIPIWHLDGVPWWEAEVPRRWHKCRVQTYGRDLGLYTVDRCACGAIRYRGKYNNHWAGRNERRKK